MKGGSEKGIQYGCWRKHVSSSVACWWWKGGVPQKRYHLLTHTASMAPGCCFISYPSGSANYSNGSFFCSLGNPHALPVITLTTQIPEMVVGKHDGSTSRATRDFLLVQQHVVRSRSGTAPRQAVGLKWRSTLNEDNCTGCCVPFFFLPSHCVGLLCDTPLPPCSMYRTARRRVRSIARVCVSLCRRVSE